MIPALTYPLALAGLVALPALAAIYFLRHKHRRLPISSLLLWQHQLKSREGGAKLDRVRLPWIFFLELLILALLVAAATGPRWQLPETTRPLIVILDDSASMLAGDEKSSPRTRAEERLTSLLRERKFHSVRFLLAGRKPRVAGAAVTGLEEIRAQLAQWTCRAPAAAIETAVALATDLGRQQAEILVLTDRPPERDDFSGGRIRWLAFGRTAPNLAFVNATRTAHGDQDRCLLELANHAATPHSAQITIRSGTNTLHRGTVPIPARSRERVILNLPANTPAIEAELVADGLAADNRVWLAPPSRRRVRVQLSVEDEPLRALLERTLESTGLRAAQNADPELVLYTSLSAPVATNAWPVRLMTHTNSAAYTGPFVVDHAHPLARGLALESVIWSATPLTNAPGYLPVISAGNIPLLFARTDALARQEIVLNLDTSASTLPTTPNWPVLFHNLLHWRLQEIPGLHVRNFRLGQDVSFRAGPGAWHWQSPEGATKTFTPVGNGLSFETDSIGLHRITSDNITTEFSVNFLVNDESDLADAKSGTWGDWTRPEETRREYASVLWIFLLLALAGLGGHLRAVTRSKGTA